MIKNIGYNLRHLLQLRQGLKYISKLALQVNADFISDSFSIQHQKHTMPGILFFTTKKRIFLA